MENNSANPYEAPEAEVFEATEDTQEYQYVGPQARSAGSAIDWIGQGYKIFSKSVGGWLLTMVVGFILMIVISLIPLVGSLFSAFTTYIWIAGMMLGCHAVFKGDEMDVKYLFAGFTQNAGKLILLSVIGLVATVALMLLFLGANFAELFLIGEGAMPEDVDPVAMTVQMLLVFACMIPLMMAVWFAPALIMLLDMGVVAAMKASFIGCLKNFVPFLIYGFLMLAIMIIAFLPLMLGFLVFMPLLYGSIYMSYRDIFLQQK